MGTNSEKIWFNAKELTQVFVQDDDSPRWFAPILIIANCMNLNGGASGGPWYSASTAFSLNSITDTDRSGNAAVTFGPRLGSNAAAVLATVNY